MALTERQRRLYASAPRGEIGRCGLSLTHPGFSRPWHLTNQPRPFEGLVAGELVTFEVHPFRIVRPEIGTSGKVDLKLDIHNSGPVFSAEFLRAAAQPRTGVRVEVNDYLPGDTVSQIDAIILSLLDIAVTAESCSGTASSADFLNKEFPRLSYTLAAFPGLDR
ncbi:DUF1833 family protein [Hyphomonas sp.]|uniref:DUF1833 family protein n=1 Tax=Hyphomonas sp. TaxID=87 RepID=UPI0025C4BF56|nr:DUF1833 family protein [Hyphomonas sp.]MBI1401459.1 DUF1833 domain-containing protein [Hyphomonas sp.]